MIDEYGVIGGVIIRRIGETSVPSDTLFNKSLKCILLGLNPALRFEKHMINCLNSKEK
jgi:hypothetical protein